MFPSSRESDQWRICGAENYVNVTVVDLKPRQCQFRVDCYHFRTITVLLK